MISFIGNMADPPRRDDIEMNFQLLREFMRAFPNKAANESEIVQGLVALDDFLRNQLSKSTVRKAQRRWASADAVALRWMICYVFGLVRTQGYFSAGKYIRRLYRWYRLLFS